MTVLPDSENGYLLNYEDQEKRRMNMQHDLIKTYMGKLILAPLPFDQPNLRVLDSGTFNGKSPLCRFDPLETNRRRPLARRRLDPPPVPDARRHRRLPNRLPSQAPPEHRVPRPVHLGPLAHRMARLVRPRPPETGDCMRAPRRRPAGAVPTHRPRQARHRLGAIHRRQSRASEPGAAEAIPCSRALPVAGGGDAASFPLEPPAGEAGAPVVGGVWTARGAREGHGDSDRGGEPGPQAGGDGEAEYARGGVEFPDGGDA